MLKFVMTLATAVAVTLSPAMASPATASPDGTAAGLVGASFAQTNLAIQYSIPCSLTDATCDLSLSASNGVYIAESSGYCHEVASRGDLISLGCVASLSGTLNMLPGCNGTGEMTFGFGSGLEPSLQAQRTLAATVSGGVLTVEGALADTGSQQFGAFFAQARNLCGLDKSTLGPPEWGWSGTVEYLVP